SRPRQLHHGPDMTGAIAQPIIKGEQGGSHLGTSRRRSKCPTVKGLPGMLNPLRITLALSKAHLAANRDVEPDSTPEVFGKTFLGTGKGHVDRVKNDTK